MYLGIDIGTSSVKSLLMDDAGNILGTASAPLAVSRPRPTWSEQDPGDWCLGTGKTLDRLHAEFPSAMRQVQGIGLSGQMHGATLLDNQDKPLRPAILWNDGRAGFECAEIESACPRSREICGNTAMPGFTAPKLLWVRRHEPEIFSSLRKVLLPKDYVRLWLSGDHISDMSDAAGTLWLDVAARAWSEEMLAATGLGIENMPRLVEGAQPGGELRADLAQRWGMPARVPLAGGAGDNAASACGIGAINPGDAFISLGTSGVIFVSNDRFMPNPAGGVHAFCHAIPETWHQMGVILSAAACFDWLASVTGCRVSDVYADLQPEVRSSGYVMFLPYLSGERTPHNDAGARGALVNLTHNTSRSDLSRAVAQGVGFALRDCIQSLFLAGARFDVLAAVGGGARSRPWLQILADILDKRVEALAQGETGAAAGAARLAMIAASGAAPADVCTPPPVTEVFEPDPAAAQDHLENWTRYRALYPALKEALGE